jgi:hypothetical protein
MRMGGGGGRAAAWAAAILPSIVFNVTLSVMFNNLINHYNPGGFCAAISTPRSSASPTSTNSGFGGGPQARGAVSVKRRQHRR